MSESRIRIDRIERAATVIDPVFLGSPQVAFGPLNDAVGCNLTLKIETLNPIRCFKGRGADLLLADAASSGTAGQIVCASAGNFGQAMAYSGSRRGFDVVVYVAEGASPFKIERMRQLGADVRQFGTDFDAAKTEAKRVATDTGARFVEDSKDIETVEGAGTIGLELAADTAGFDAVLVPLGNGSLLNGIATAVKARVPETRMIAVQAAGAPAMIESWRSKRLVESEAIDTIADGIAVRVPVQEALDDMSGIVDDGLLVDDGEIIAAMQLVHHHAGLVTEPSGAIGVAAVRKYSSRFEGKRVATIVCGSNLATEQMKAWL
ncbi:MAG: threonine ammonia-lyase [Hyphomicrobiaceae bacterium]